MGKSHYGSRNPFWKGGRSVASNGYVLIRVGVEHHLADVKGLRLRASACCRNETWCGCGQAFPTFDSGGRPRRFVTGHNMR